MPDVNRSHRYLLTADIGSGEQGLLLHALEPAYVNGINVFRSAGFMYSGMERVEIDLRVDREVQIKYLLDQLKLSGIQVINFIKRPD